MTDVNDLLAEQEALLARMDAATAAPMALEHKHGRKGEPGYPLLHHERFGGDSDDAQILVSPTRVQPYDPADPDVYELHNDIYEGEVSGDDPRWASMPIQDVQISQLAFVQESFVPSHVREVAASDEPIHVIPLGSNFLLHDGNHRALRALDEGRTTIKARVWGRESKGLPVTSYKGFAEEVLERKHLMGLHDQRTHGFRRGGKIDAAVDVDSFLKKVPARNPGEEKFKWQSRILQGLAQEEKGAVLARIRERYSRCEPVARAATAYRTSRGLPEPKVNWETVRADVEKAKAVADAYVNRRGPHANTSEAKNAYADFKRQNEEMFDLITRPASAGGLGITVDFVDAMEPYESAEAQELDVEMNRHISITKGERFIPDGHPHMSADEYSRFRAVHDIFGHVAIGGGFDRHGEYAAWLAHNTMYEGEGRRAMSAEYHGTNSVLWSTGQFAETTGDLLPVDLTLNTWNEAGYLVRKSGEPDPIDDLIGLLGLDAEFANRFDNLGHLHLAPAYRPPNATKSIDATLAEQQRVLEQLEQKHGQPGRPGYEVLHPGKVSQGLAWTRAYAGDKPLWSLPAPPFESIPKDFSYDDKFLPDRLWKAEVRKALGRGDLTRERAKELGYWANGHDNDDDGRVARDGSRRGWQPLPSVLYHVTTNAPSVERDGAKTRDELEQSSGAGLGGGESDTISFTVDEDMAHTVKRSMLEARRVARGEITARDLVERAREGIGTREPFLRHIVRAMGGGDDWKDGDPLPLGLQGLIDGRKIKITSSTALLQSDHPDWEPIGEGWEGGDGQRRYAQWRVPMESDEVLEETFDLFKTFSAWRAYSGGLEDPLFFGSDWRALAQSRPEDIQILEFTPQPGAQGYPVAGMAEWRTTTGSAVRVTRRVKALGVGIDATVLADFISLGHEGTGSYALSTERKADLLDLEHKRLSEAQRAEVEAETLKIRENRKAAGAKPHRFRPAEWTHPNGHPRCLLCGDEESTEDRCPGYEAKGLQLARNEDLVEKVDRLIREGASEKEIQRVIREAHPPKGNPDRTRRPKYPDRFEGKHGDPNRPGYHLLHPDSPTLQMGKRITEVMVGGSPIPVIQPEHARGDSRSVSVKEFTELADEGRGMLAKRQANSSPPDALDAFWVAIKQIAFDLTRNSWGGTTVDTHTAREVGENDDTYAITIKVTGADTVSIPEDADRGRFDAAMEEARKRFADVLAREGTHLGVFRDDLLKRIDIDPVLVVDTLHEVEAIGAYTYAIGGAYHFRSGDGFFPPHVGTPEVRRQLLDAGLVREDDLAGVKSLDDQLAHQQAILDQLEGKHGQKDEIGYELLHPNRRAAVGPHARESTAGIGVYDSAASFSEAHQEKMKASLKGHGYTKQKIVNQMLRVAGRNTTAEADSRWYHDEHDNLSQLADENGVSLGTVAAVTAAFSPLTEWGQNYEDAVEAVKGWAANIEVTIDEKERDEILIYDTREDSNRRKHPTDVTAWIGTHRLQELPPEIAAAISSRRYIGLPRGMGYRDKLEKALPLLQGDQPGDMLNGPKTRAFFSNLAIPGDPKTVTVDTHMVRAMVDDVMLPSAKLGKMLSTPGSDRETGPEHQMGIGLYPVLADAIREAAEKFEGGRFTASEFQALVWVQWIREHPAIERREATTKAIKNGTQKRSRYNTEQQQRQRAKRAKQIVAESATVEGTTEGSGDERQT